MKIYLKNKNVLILGGTGSIGSTIATLLEESGATVFRHGRSGEYSADLSDVKQIHGLINKILAKGVGIDILINSISSPAVIKSFEKKDWNDFLNHINVQLKSCIETTKLVLPHMKENKYGRIINILSTSTIGEPPASLSDYVTAKYAMLGLTKALAREFGKYNITVNAVSPSFIKNSFTNSIPDKLTEIMISQTPLNRLAVPQDVANVVLFLASELSGYMTGENLIVSGGSIMD